MPCIPHATQRTALLIACALLLAVACSRKSEAPGKVPPLPSNLERRTPELPLAEKSGLVPPTVRLKVYPDMAVPGKEVVVEVELVPHVVSEHPSYSFRTLSDPCDGTLEQEGARVVYAVPSECRGSGITIEATVQGSFGSLVESVTLDVKKTSFMDSVVFTYPLPGQKAVSPLSVWWDRTLYENRQEKLSFHIKRFGEDILRTGDLSAGAVVELDIPPSPEEIVLFGETTSGSRETALIRVYSRRVPEWPSSVLMLDRFALADTNSMDAPRTVLNEGGECDLGLAWRISADGQEPFLYMHYHVSKAKRYGRNEALMGFREEVPVRATREGYKEIEVWLRGDPVRGAALPVYVRTEGSKGSTRTFKIKRIRDNWRPYHFPLYKALRASSDERLTAVSIFVDGKDVTPPLGTILFGGLYLVPHPSPEADEEE